MPTIELIGRITEAGLLDVQLPAGLPAGQVQIRIEIPELISEVAPVQAEPHGEMASPAVGPPSTARPSKNEGNGSTEWLHSQRRQTARQNANANDYRLKWIRYKTQQRRRTYRRSLNREKS